jgi:hypothetical protein
MRVRVAALIALLFFSFAGIAQGALAEADLSLPVVVLRTSQALPQTLHYPARVRMRVPAQWARVLSAYGVDGVVLIAPTRWTGEGSMGVDGGASATLHPAVAASTAIGHLTYLGIPACYGCAVDESARYFTWARTSYSSLIGASNLPIPAPRPLLHKVTLAHSLLAYQAPNTLDGLEVNGVAFSTVDRTNPCNPRCFLFSREEAALPAFQHALASVLLNVFIANNVPNAAK